MSTTSPAPRPGPRRQTRRSIYVTNLVARVCITAGGIATIVAVLGVCLFLVWEVVPLFLPAKVGEPLVAPAGGLDAVAGTNARILRVGTDEHRLMGWYLSTDGALRAFRLSSGELIATRTPFGDRKLVAASFSTEGEELALAFADGGIQLANIGFSTRFLDPSEVPVAVQEELAGHPLGHSLPLGEGMVELTSQGQFRVQELEVTLGEARELAGGTILCTAFVRTGNGLLLCALAQDGGAATLHALAASDKANFTTGARTLKWKRPVTIPLQLDAGALPTQLLLSGDATNLFVLHRNGAFERLDCTSLGATFVAERGRLTPPGVDLTAAAMVLGDATLVWGDAEGRLRAGFLVRREELGPDQLVPADRQLHEGSLFVLLETKQLGHSGAAVTSLAASSRSRMILAGYADGSVRLFNVTASQLIADIAAVDPPQAAEAVALSPKEDGLLVLRGGRALTYELGLRHPEASMASIFAPVWYERYSAPAHTWQSSSGHASFEPKLGLVPLVFGTLKATFYSMLFGAALALLAAIYTSEFLAPRTRAAIKPTIELMASLPSVVLGFLAALVFAPFAESRVPALLLLFFTIPFSLLLGSHLWQLLSKRRSLWLARWRLLLTVPVIFAGMALAWWLAAPVERWLFAGDVKAWLSWHGNPAVDSSPYASTIGGWMLPCLPLCAIAAFVASQVYGVPLLQRLDVGSRLWIATLDLVRFLLTCVVAIVAALLLSGLLSAAGWDPRGSFVDTYVQRNALIVGFVMGFAIIPIIYTIADDALTAVPDHLRSASLGAGATQWQTAIRIVVPTAMSGLFSALMIGLGRAVGETMIVLMAAGNTPIMEWNVFAGFRTLSANIAVELPEAVEGSTHYRMLFLAALVLFGLTFVVNTIAEVVRMRFRRRAYQL